MYITFRNNSKSDGMIITVENQRYTVNPESSVEVFCQSPKFEFVAELSPMVAAASVFDTESHKLKYRLLSKAAKKITEKVSELALITAIRYEVDFDGYQNSTIDLFDGDYSVLDSIFFDFFDMMPVEFYFPRAESTEGKLRVIDADAINRKKYLRMARNILLFVNVEPFLISLFFFIPEYILVKFFASHFYLKRLFCGLYKKSAEERAEILYKKEQLYENDDTKKGCLTSLFKVFIVLLILGSICYWAMTSDPDVVISEDFSSVVCFDETFVKIDGGLPADAEDVFLEDYTAYYILPDGEYDMDNYYCYIYETPDGTRYMWVKDDCSNEENADKGYEDYENPLVYKSVGEQTENE